MDFLKLFSDVLLPAELKELSHQVTENSVYFNKTSIRAPGYNSVAAL